MRPADAELAEPRFESVGVGSIPRGVVFALAQDRDGFLWLGTGDGLVRHDGHRFRQQGRDDGHSEVRSLGFIRTLLAGRDGRLWIGTESDGLASYDPATERVRLHRGTGDRGVPEPTVRALAEDAYGAIWVATMGNGLARFDPASERFTTYHRADPGGGLPDDRVLSLLVDRQGSLWVGTWQGLSRRVAGSDRFEPVLAQAGSAASLAGRTVLSLFQASDGRIWVGTQQGELTIVDPRTGQGTRLDDTGATAAAGQGAVAGFVEAPGGRVWVGRAAGIELREVQSGHLLRRLRHDPRKPTGLAGNEVRSLLLDQAGWIWVGGIGGGLQRHNPGNRAIRVRDADPMPGSPFEAAHVTSVLPLDDGSIWLGTQAAGAVVMDTQLRVTGVVRPPPHTAVTAVTEARAAAATSRVDAMMQARDGSVWMGTDTGLHQFDRAHRLLRTVQHGAGMTNRLLTAQDGSIWVGTQDGLYTIEPGAHALVRLMQRGGQPLVGDVYAIVEAADRTLWVGTERGLFRLGPGERELAPVKSPSGAGLGNPAVIGLLIDRQQALWLDTAVAGLHRLRRWDDAQAEFERISERHGIVGRPFGVNLLEDTRGRIWSQQFVYDPATDHLSALTSADGVDIGTGWFRSYAKTADGRMLFGGSKGLLVVEPELFDSSTYLPPLVVSELRVDGQRQPAGSMQAGLQLSPQNRSFSVEFAALDYSDPARSRYAYRLEGFDPDWIATGAEFRIASYSNLDPGDYRLRVRATNRSGVWSTHELAIAVQVLPAWWQGWSFRLAMLVVLAAALMAVVQLRTRYLRRRQWVLENKVRERTTELEALSLALAERSAELEAASLSDPLTGLYNRRFLAQHIESDAALAVRHHEDHWRHGEPVADDADLIFFLVDIDHFKQVNDQHGHAAGDAVLVEVCGRLQQVFRDSDHLVRWGGEEFLIVARGTSRCHAAELAERARARVADLPFVLDDGSVLRKTCSIGFACFPPSPDFPRALDWSTAISLADAALYQVKHEGRNGWLGVLSAHGESAASLCEGARQPLAQWHASGALQMAGSRAGAFDGGDAGIAPDPASPWPTGHAPTL